MTLNRKPMASRRRLAGAFMLFAIGLAPGAVAAQGPPGPPAADATGEGSMGRVVAVLIDGRTGAPIPEALVSLDALRRRTLSDSAGSAIFLDIPPTSCASESPRATGPGNSGACCVR